MPKKRVFVDTNVILECFRIKVWSELTQRCQVETVRTCYDEALAGNSLAAGYIQASAAELENGCHAIHAVSQADEDKLILEYEDMLRLDPGELHLFAYLYANNVRLSEVVVLSTADKGAIVRANDHPGWLDWVQSLQEVLHEAGITGKKVEALGRQHTSAFLSKVRTDVRNGVIP